MELDALGNRFVHPLTTVVPYRLNSLVAGMLLLIVLTACPTSGVSAAGATRSDKRLYLSEAQVQIKVRALADPFSGAIEETIWRLWETTQDPAERRNLLIWQIDLVNAFQRATFQPNPIAALVDTWALVEQFREFVESRSSDVMNVEQKKIVLETIGGMEEALYAIAAETFGDDDAREVQGLIEDWAEEHPMNRFATRESPRGEMAEWSARANLGALATVKSLGATLDDVMARLDLYAEYLPKQASWHAQAMVFQMAAQEGTARAFTDLSTTASAFDRIADSLEGYPDVVADERRIVLETVERERAHILDQLLSKATELELFINEQRIDLVENQLRIEREAIFEAIAAERAIIVAEAKRERADTMDEFEVMIDDLIETSAIKVVDHFFLRAVQLVAILLVGLGIIAVIVVVLWRKR